MLTRLQMRKVKAQPLCSVRVQVYDQVRAEAKAQVDHQIWTQVERLVQWPLLDQIQDWGTL